MSTTNKTRLHLDDGPAQRNATPRWPEIDGLVEHRRRLDLRDDATTVETLGAE